MENFLFLLIIAIFQILALKIRLELLTIVVSFFGIVLALSVQSEIAYPLFNIFVIFLCIMNLYDYRRSKAST